MYLALAVILLAALALRLLGIDWDRGHFFHPDERFIIQFKVPELRALWPLDLPLFLDTARSPWNPHWFAYGTFPIYLLKAMQQVATAIEPAFALDHLRFIGRGLSALADTGSVLLVYLLGARLYGRRAGLLAAAFLALAVIHIQLSHFATFDVQLAFWVLLALYGASRLMDRCDGASALLTGLALGLGLATKVSILPLAIPVACAYLLYAVGARHASPLPAGGGPASPAHWRRAVGAGMVTAGVAAVAFVLAQPYAVLDWPTFLRDTREQSEMALRVRDFPYTRQYEGTPAYLYQIQQLATWGLGFPLGVAAWLGVLASGWWAWRRGHRGDILLLSWVIPYFVFTGAFPVKFLRYLVPITPLLLLMGARLLLAFPVLPRVGLRTHLGTAVIALVLAPTAFYALAFLNVYRTEHPALQMSRWIKDNVPPGKLILKEHWEEGVPGLEAYRSDDELKLYEPDTPAKLTKLSQQLQDADYVLFFSNRLYGSIPRLPARYPMSREYYRLLFSGELGYEIAHVTQAYPSLLGITLHDDTFARPGLPRPSGLPDSEPGIVLNTGYADESFTAYDHPRVMLFRRIRPVASEEVVGLLLPALGSAQNALPSGGLMMSPQVRAAQQAGGTWSDLFQPDSPANRAPVLVWLMVIEIAGLFAYPIAHALFSRFPDRGYLLCKSLGLLLIAYPVWLAASLHIAPFTSHAVATSLAGLGVVGGLVAWRTRGWLQETLRSRWRFLLGLEMLFLAVFFAFLVVRLMNPDLWHPARGGEKPMDFAYLNAIIKSAYMPPYDPWFSGGYLNYYYFGQFMVAALVKLTGIIPSVAYNLAVPTLFAFLVCNAFAAGAALVGGGFVPRLAGRPVRLTDPAPGRMQSAPTGDRARRGGLHAPGWVSINSAPVWVGGASAALGAAVLGNLDGGVQVLEWLRKSGSGDVRSTIPGITGLIEVATGLVRAPLETVAAPAFDYWRSRGMGGIDPNFIDPVLRAPSISIVEFPFFTFLFADLHAHLIALPFAVLSLAFALQAALGLAGARFLARLMFLGFAGLTLGALRWTNSWDYPTYFVLLAGAIAIGELAARRSPATVIFRSVAQAVLLFGFSALLFRPFQETYQLFFAGGLLPSPEATPPGIYLRIHGLFLLVLLGFIGFELRERFGGFLVFRVAGFIRRRGYRPVRAWRLYNSLGRRHTDAALLVRQRRLAEYGRLPDVAQAPSPVHAAGGGCATANLRRGTVVVALEVRPQTGGAGLHPARTGWKPVPPNSAGHLSAGPLAAVAAVCLGLLLVLGFGLVGAATAGLLLMFMALLVLLGMEELRTPSERGPAYLVVLALAGSAAGLSLLVEVVKLDIPGEIQRMNTVFKLYLQVWVLYAVSSAYGFWWVARRVPWRKARWHVGRSVFGAVPLSLRVWLAGVALLLAGSAAYPLLATPVRVADRFAPQPPTLDGAAYMEVATQREREHPIELKWDYEAIRWLEAHVDGSPVVLEASTPIYRWGSRISINTGLPTVLGWDWHQSQQRWDYRAEVELRKNHVTSLYSDTDPGQALVLLRQYNVRYVVVGALERAFYPEAGLRKFDQMAAAGTLSVAYQNQDVKIYEVPEGA